VIIDWDRVLAAPAILTRKPPIWLWDFSDEFQESPNSIGSDYDGDVDLLDPKRYDSTQGRLSEADQQGRARFESRLVEGLRGLYASFDKDAYLEEAYGKGRWIRRLARFAIHGASDSQDLTRFEHLDRDWTEFAKSAKATPAAESLSLN
jgi:hypothetical protein